MLFLLLSLIYLTVVTSVRPVYLHCYSVTQTTATNNFYQFRLNRNNTIRQEMVRWNEIIAVLDSINTTPVTPDQKLAFIIRTFDGDTRQFVSNGMSHAVIEQWDYDLTMQRLLHDKI